MISVFADTSYWIALINESDDLHRAAQAVSSNLGRTEIYTSDSVLVEVLNYFSARGTQARRVAHHAVTKIMNDPMILVVEQTRQTFYKGYALYSQRFDKAYSLTDCISMQIMHDHRITHCLTGDHHFAQEGFVQMLN